MRQKNDIKNSHFSLSAMPNPCNSSTVIEVKLPGIGELEVGIFNLQGKCVRKLFQNKVSGNIYQLGWQGRNDQGQYLANGIYIVKTIWNGQKRLMKLTFIK